ncbi:MAG TPA: glycoside hydrolase family 15 protein [Chthonomonadaceae bacterium]|nr:glycoside hydrolase family 15 protein [Chthonomonadaceae bacterium]
MPRPLVLGNGNILVAFDRDIAVRDFTFPYVGLLNHLSGHRIRLGIWCDGRFAWMDDAGWACDLRYRTDTLVTDVRCEHRDMGIALALSDCVLHRDDILLRRIEVLNRLSHARDVRIFLSHDFYLAETDFGDTAFYNPYLDAVIHYKRDTYLLISGRAGDDGLYQYTTGIKGFRGAEGTWRDAEDGALSMNPVEQGSVDSTISFRFSVPASGTATVQSWICAGHTISDVTRLQQRIAKIGFDALLQQTASYWTAWVCCEAEEARLATLPPEIAGAVRRSLLVIRTQIDNRGAIIAANDSDIMETARAHYSYMWPRDGALVAQTLDRLGYQDITRRFFEFCRDRLPADRPALMHKYSADGSWGATWHPWKVGDQNEVPFQQDSTALVIWALWRHYSRHQDLEFIEDLYRELVAPAADFIVAYRDPRTGLPRPSYDLWEERRGVNAFTCGTVFAALRSAATFAELFSDSQAAAYSDAAEEVRRGVSEHLWDEGSGRFARRLIVHADGSYERDMTIDAAVYALFAFGAFPADDPRIERTMQQTLSRLWVQTGIGGVARYEDDYYFRRSEDLARVPGNPWIICTLWAAQYHIARAREPSDLEKPLGLLTWAARRATASGVLPEQVHPYTGEHLSVSPLTWSHAELVSTTLQYLDKRDALKS